MKNNFDIADFIGILILLIIGLCICFSISFYEVKAAVIPNSTPIEVGSFDSVGNYTLGSFNYTNILGNQVFKFQTNKADTQRVLYRYNSGTLKGGTYNLSFYLIYSSGGYTPIVTANYSSCQIVYSYLGEKNVSSNYDIMSYYGVYCPNVYIDKDAFDVHISSLMVSDHIIAGVGFVSYSSADSNEALTDIQDSIDKQAEQQHKDSQATQDKIQSVDDTLNDGSVDSDAINSIGSNLPGTNGVLSSILSMPLSFFNSLLNNLSSTSCPVINFNLPIFDMPCSIPCFRSFLSDLGVLIWFEGIGGLIGGLFLFKYIIHLGKTFNKMSDLDDTNNESWGGL